MWVFGVVTQKKVALLVVTRKIDAVLVVTKKMMRFWWQMRFGGHSH